MEKPRPPKRRLQLVADARKLGIEQPERFRTDELESLIASLPVQPEPAAIALPTSSELHKAPVEGEATRPKRWLVPIEPYLDNPFFKEPEPSMPPLLGRDEIWLLPVEPEWMMATWDVSEHTLGRARAGEGPTTLRVQSPDVPGYVDAEVDLRAPGWWMKTPRERVRVVGFIGFGRGADFRPVCESPVVSIPPRKAAVPRPTFRAAVPYDLDRREIPERAAEQWQRGEPSVALPQVTVSEGPSVVDTVERIRAMPKEELQAIFEEEELGDWEGPWIETDWTEEEWLEMWSFNMSSAMSSAMMPGRRKGRAREKGRFRVPRKLEGVLPPLPWNVPLPSSGIPSSGAMPTSSRSSTSRAWRRP